VRCWPGAARPGAFRSGPGDLQPARLRGRTRGSSHGLTRLSRGVNRSFSTWADEAVSWWLANSSLSDTPVAPLATGGGAEPSVGTSGPQRAPTVLTRPPGAQRASSRVDNGQTLGFPLESPPGLEAAGISAVGPPPAGGDGGSAPFAGPGVPRWHRAILSRLGNAGKPPGLMDGPRSGMAYRCWSEAVAAVSRNRLGIGYSGSARNISYSHMSGQIFHFCISPLRGLGMLQLTALAVAAVIEVMAITAWLAFTAGRMAGLPARVHQGPLAATTITPHQGPSGTGADHHEGDGWLS
jgi:hypothetical protein